jgi:hypothetical protein
MGSYPNHGELHVKRLTSPNPQEDPLPLATIDWSGASPALSGDPETYLNGEGQWTVPVIKDDGFGEWQQPTVNVAIGGSVASDARWRTGPGNVVR